MCPDTDFPRVSLYGTIISFHEIIIRGVCHAISTYGCKIIVLSFQGVIIRGCAMQF